MNEQMTVDQQVWIRVLCACIQDPVEENTTENLMIKADLALKEFRTRFPSNSVKREWIVVRGEADLDWRVEMRLDGRANAVGPVDVFLNQVHANHSAASQNCAYNLAIADMEGLK